MISDDFVIGLVLGTAMILLLDRPTLEEKCVVQAHYLNKMQLEHVRGTLIDYEKYKTGQKWYMDNCRQFENESQS